MFPLNVNIVNITRVKAANRYGEPKRAVIATDLLGFLDRSGSVVRNADGGFSDIEATLRISREIKPQDKVKFQNGDTYYVHSVTHEGDVLGCVDHYTCYLTKEL